MAAAQEKISKQSGARGYFAEVELDVENGAANGHVDVTFEEKNSRWQSGALFGIDYALEHISKRQYFPNGITVHIKRIHGHDVDTTNTLIAFATVNALLKALNANPKNRPDLKFDEGVVVFPK